MEFMNLWASNDADRSLLTVMEEENQLRVFMLAEYSMMTYDPSITGRPAGSSMARLSLTYGAFRNKTIRW